jgi:predicted kinase
VKKLICLCGLPRSGKTTHAVSLGHPIVCPDAVRLAIHGQPYVQAAESFVWATARAMVKALFLAGHETVVFDATNVTRKRRADNKPYFPQNDPPEARVEWEVEYHVIDTTVEVCLSRARACGRPDLMPIIGRMARDFEAVGPDEGRVVVVAGS